MLDTVRTTSNLLSQSAMKTGHYIQLFVVQKKCSSLILNFSREKSSIKTWGKHCLLLLPEKMLLTGFSGLGPQSWGCWRKYDMISLYCASVKQVAAWGTQQIVHYSPSAATDCGLWVRAQKTLSVQGQVINTYSFAHHTVSVTATHLCPCSSKAASDKWMIMAKFP